MSICAAQKLGVQVGHIKDVTVPINFTEGSLCHGQTHVNRASESLAKATPKSYARIAHGQLGGTLFSVSFDVGGLPV